MVKNSANQLIADLLKILGLLMKKNEKELPKLANLIISLKLGAYKKLLIRST